MMGGLFLALILSSPQRPPLRPYQGHLGSAGRARQPIVGYGLVVGLQGSGDTLRNAPFTEESVQAMLEPGPRRAWRALRNRNVASVIVTTDLVAGAEPARGSTSRSRPSAMRRP